MQQFSSIHNAAFGAALYGYAPAGTAALDADAPYRPPDDAAALMSTPPRHLHTRAPAAESPLAAETLGLTSLAARLSIGADLAPAPRAAERYEPPAPARPPVPGWPLRSAPAPPPLPVWSPGGYAAAATAAAATAALPPAPASMPRARADASWPYMPGLPVAEAPPAGPPACYRAPARQAALREEQPHGYSLRSRGPPAPPPAQRTPAHAAPPAPPPPPAPMTPPLRRGMSPAAALRSLGHLLTPAERAEVATYREVWFAGRPGCAKVRGAAAAGPNGGFDDARGDYRAAPGNHVAFRYELQHVLGRGSFGQVVRALDHAAGGAPVALKIIRNKARFARQAQVEAAILAALGAADPAGTSGAVRMLEAFTFRSHLCITFECLAENLYEHLKAGGFVGCAPELVTRTARTVLRCLAFLRRLDIVHCDLKPENILLVGRGASQVRVIDFGSSCYSTQRIFTYIQSRFYRAPEVILGLPYGAPIDVWSLGCVLAELLTGHPLFPGEDEAEQLARVIEALGPPPPALLAAAPRRALFFDAATGAPLAAARPDARRRVFRPGAVPLEAALRGRGGAAFLDFLRGCLRWDPAERLAPEEALAHPWMREPRAPPPPSA